MTATNHGLAGAAIALSLHNYPAVALALAFASHFVLDSVPHFGFDEIGGHLKIKKSLFFKILLADATLLAALMVFLLARGAPILVFSCLFLAGSPDFVWAYRYIFQEKLGKIKPGPMNALSQFHSKIQWSQTTRGVIVEIPVMIALFIFVASRL